MKKSILNPWIVGFLFILAGCVSTTGSPSGVAGTYYAGLPCQKCNRLIVDLLLEKDNTYTMVGHPKNSVDEYYEVGTWHTKSGKLILTPAPNTAANAEAVGVVVKDFLVQKNQLVLLNKEGKSYQKPERYTFEKK